MKKKRLIDYGELEQWIITIEDMFKTDNLQIEEQRLVLGKVSERISSREQKQKMSDAVINVPIKDLMKKIMRGD